MRAPNQSSAAPNILNYMQINYNNKHLVGALIVAGWDKQKGGQVFCIPIGGTLVEERWAADGSGSIFLLGYLDATYRSGITLCLYALPTDVITDMAVSISQGRYGPGCSREDGCNCFGSGNGSRWLLRRDDPHGCVQQRWVKQENTRGRQDSTSMG